MFDSSARRALEASQIATQYQAGMTAYETGRFEDAVSILSRIADRMDLTGTMAKFHLGRAHLHLGMTALRERRFREASDHLQRAAALNPTTADLPRYLAASYVGQKRFDLAAIEFEKQCDRRTDDDAVIRRALAEWRLGRLTHALSILWKAVHDEPRRADLRFQLGLMQWADEDRDVALKSLAEAVRLAPLNAEYRRHLGLALGCTGDLVGAVEHLRAAQQIHPNDACNALLLGRAMQAAGSDVVSCDVPPVPPAAPAAAPETIERLGEIITRDPDFVEAFLSLPQTGVDREVFATLAATLRWATERRPELADLHYHCSRVLDRLGDREDAIAEGRRAVEIRPDFVAAMIQLGRLYAETDRTQEAIDRLRAAIDAGGDYADVHLLLGQLHRRTGDPAAARRAFQRAIEINSDFQAARRALRELAVVEGA
ncbi:MAG: tetratricopeptide repeat protein [Phycisphaerae bacterium]|nr:tetratricopeptide repeat protein [Phycisphaerae bacterium]